MFVAYAGSMNSLRYVALRYVALRRQCESAFSFINKIKTGAVFFTSGNFLWLNET